MIQRRVVKCAADGSITSEYYDDVSWVQVRVARDRALADSDWRALKDVVLSTEWREFRDSLRTLPQRFDDPNDAADHFPRAPDA